MSIRRLPFAVNFEPLSEDEDACPLLEAVEKWRAHNVRLAAAPNGPVLDILEPIYPGGIRARDVADKLRGMTGDLTVNINSPGGLYSDGVAIHGMLDQYPGKVLVNVIGFAASAASLIAMAGDVIKIHTAGAIMLHNAQAGVDGDRRTMLEAAELLGKHDAAIKRIYAARTGQTEAALDKMMAPLSGTYLFGKEAVDAGFADSLLGDDAVVKAEAPTGIKTKGTRAYLEAVLAEKGHSRKERREMFREAFPDRAPPENPPPVDKTVSLAQIADMIRNIGKPRAA